MDYDNVDLGILAILIIGIVGMIASVAAGAFGPELWSFAGMCVTGIAGLAGKVTKKDG